MKVTQRAIPKTYKTLFYVYIILKNFSVWFDDVVLSFTPTNTFLFAETNTIDCFSSLQNMPRKFIYNFE